MPEWLLLIHAAATLFMTGLIWTMQIVHYPLMAGVGSDCFVEYEARHVRQITPIVATTMGVELATAIALLIWRPAAVGLSMVIVGLVLLALIWGSTAAMQVPQHRRLSQGFDATVHHSLVQGNWLRTALWTGRSVLVLVMLAGVMR